MARAITRRRDIEAARVRDAVAAAESRTSAEIVVAIAPFFVGRVWRAARRAFVRLGVARNTTDHPTKILGAGDIKHPLLVSADKFSSSAEKKILAAGGKIKQV